MQIKLTINDHHEFSFSKKIVNVTPHWNPLVTFSQIQSGVCIHWDFHNDDDSVCWKHVVWLHFALSLNTTALNS
jgi:hypothetical protein